jgi:hypothetical protein
VLLGASISLQARGQQVAIASSGETTVSAKLIGTNAKALFRTSALSTEDGDSHRFAQCTSSRNPCILLSQLQIFWRGHEIIVPRSAYADLGDATTAQLSVAHQRLMLTIRGGDASEAYIARIEFNEQRVLERRLYSSEDASHVLEVSQYR